MLLAQQTSYFDAGRSAFCNVSVTMRSPVSVGFTTSNSTRSLLGVQPTRAHWAAISAASPLDVAEATLTSSVPLVEVESTSASVSFFFALAWHGPVAHGSRLSTIENVFDGADVIVTTSVLVATSVYPDPERLITGGFVS